MVIPWRPVASLTAFAIKVGHQGVATGEQDVVRLDVAMDHALTMGIPQGVSEVAENPDRIGERQLAVASQPGSE